MTKSPFPLPGPEALQDLLGALPEPPEWLRKELQNRCVLLLNHVLMQEPQAMDRLRRQQGKVIAIHWSRMLLTLQATPGGLLALAQPDRAPDLRLALQETSPLTLARTVLEGGRPPVDIQGDVQLAAEVAWLADNVRWDVEEDLSRLVGDPMAYRIVAGARSLREGLEAFVRRAVRRETP